MKTLLKFILIALFCISKIKSACTGTTQSTCEEDTTCKWTETAAGACSGAEGCNAHTAQAACETAGCTWTPATGTCGAKTCADYTGQSACNAVATCNWSNNACTTRSSPATTTCTSYTTESTCNAVTTCQWSNNACTTKSSTTTTCSSYTTESTCKAVTTCQWSNNACSAKSTTTPTTTTPDENDDDGVFGLKSSILIFLISFLF